MEWAAACRGKVSLRGQYRAKFADVDGLRDLQAGDQGNMVKTVLAGCPRAANRIECSQYSRGRQTS